MRQKKASISESNLRQKVSTVLAMLQKLLTAFFLFTLPIVYYVLNTDMSYPKVIFAFGMISIILILWAIQYWIKGGFHLHLPALFWPAVLFGVSALLSTLNATSVGTTLQSLAVLVYFVLFYIYISNVVQHPRTLYFYLSVVMLSMLPAGGYLLLQIYNLVPGNGINGAIGTMGNPIAVAQFLDSILLAGLILFMGKASSWMKSMLLLVYLIGFTAFFATNSTGPFMSLVAALVLFGISLMVFRHLLKPALRIKIWIVGIMAMVFAGWVFASQPSWLDLAKESIRPSVAELPEDSLAASQVNATSLVPPIYKQWRFLTELWESNSGDLRAFYWGVGLEMFKDKPFFGIGLGHYKVRYPDYGAKLIQRPEGQQMYQKLDALREKNPNITLRPAQAHNEYVQVVAEMGGFGATTVLIILVVLVWSGLDQLRIKSNPQKQFKYLLLYAGVFTFTVDSIFNFPGHLPAASLNVMLLLGLAHSRYFYPEKKRVSIKHWGRHLLATVVVVTALVVSILAYRDWQANIHLERGIVYLQNDLFQLASQEFDQSLKLDFEPSAVLYHLGTLEIMKNNPDAAQTYFEQSLKTRVFEDTVWRLANIHFQAGRYLEARSYLDQVKVIFPDKSLLAETAYLDALIELRLERVEKAIELAKETLETHPDFQQMYLILADAALIQQDYENAFDHYQKGLEYVNQEISAIKEYMETGGQVPAAGLQQLAQLELQKEKILEILSQLAKALNR